MNLIEHTTPWAQGDAMQGRIMLAVGIVTLIAAIAIFLSDHTILKGMLIPLALFVAVFGGYGSFLAFSRGGHLENVKTLHAENPDQAIDEEIKKADRDFKAYSMAMKIWPLAIAGLAILLVFISGDYWKGLILGLMTLFLGVLLIDITMHHRLEPYRAALQSLEQQHT